MDTKKGRLYLVATPIGNLEDMTYRGIRILKEVDLIAAEDTRNSKKLLQHYQIMTPMTSYHEHNKYDKGRWIVDVLRGGKRVALITDAGTPGISDPGEVLVQLCIQEGIVVVPIPGAVAGINGLICSGMETKQFFFQGFLSHQKKERSQSLELLSKQVGTIILYEAPHRLRKTLEEIYQVMGNRLICLGRELTKVHEEFLRMPLKEMIGYYQENTPRGEYVLIIEGYTLQEQMQMQQNDYQKISIKEHMDMYLQQGMDKKEAMKQVAKQRGISKREVYNSLI